MDDELSERARRLFEVAMAQDVPPDAVVEDSWGMVVARVTEDTERASPPPPVVAAGGSRATLRIGIVVAVALALVGGAWVALRPAPAPPIAHEPATDAPAPVTAPAIERTPARREPPPAQLLDDAEAALATAPARALELVDRHAELAPARDAERRMALRIAVLCALGRTDEARAQATAFLATPRTDEWARRVRASCGGSGAQ